MQRDMHYNATFAMAYAAGFDLADAHVVATSAQTVDDNNLTELHELESRQGVMGVATAHHPLDAGKRVLTGTEEDSRVIWVPFHFLPGNEGHTFEQRLRCSKDSELARKMMGWYTEPETVAAHRAHALHLLGIAAHVYCDTFSHYGFSGIPSGMNDVDESTIQTDQAHSESILRYIRSKAQDFKERFVARVAGAVSLGHGAVSTYPDRPYL